MALEIGRYDVRITRNEISTLADKDAVILSFETASGDTGRAVIYLTPKSMGIARACLKIAGFDCDAGDLTELITKPELLAGRTLPVLVEEYNGKMRAQVALNSAPGLPQVKKYQEALRNVKKAGSDDDDPSSLPF